jgi:hypothetical protein
MTKPESTAPGFQIAAPESSRPGRSLFNRSAIMAIQDLPTEDVRIPEWETGSEQVWIRVRGLTGKERDKYELSITVGKGQNKEINARNARAKLVVMCVVDEKGERLFSDDDVSWLGDKSAQALERIFDVARRLSGLSDTDVKELTEDFD